MPRNYCSLNYSFEMSVLGTKHNVIQGLENPKADMKQVQDDLYMYIHATALEIKNVEERTKA